MKHLTIVNILILLLINNISLAQEELRDQIISDIETIIKPQYGEDYIVDIDFADSLIGRYSENGLFKFEDKSNLGCILFGAVKYYGSRDSGIFGIFRDGAILWHTAPFIKGVWSSMYLIKDINKDSKIDILTSWDKDGFLNEDIWIFSWDGNKGEIINDYYNDSTSWQYGFSKISGTLNSFELCDFEDDDILEIRSLGKKDYKIYSWNGFFYGNWP
jgi:hypothetical protein